MKKKLSRTLVAAIDESSILGIRAGARSDHCFTGVWPIVLDGRVFARSWSRKPDGWYSVFLVNPLGTIQVGKRHVRIRAVKVLSERVRDAIEEAYAAKYPTPSSRKYVRGFRTAARKLPSLAISLRARELFLLATDSE
jgi:hypothetical protein